MSALLNEENITLIRELNRERQDEELSVLISIYGDEILSHTYKYDVRKLELRMNADALLRITLTDRYPTCEGPAFDIVGRNISDDVRKQIEHKLEAVHAASGNEVVLYDCIELCKECFSAPSGMWQDVDTAADRPTTTSSDLFIAGTLDRVTENVSESPNGGGELPAAISTAAVPLAPFVIYHGEPITDRKSTFQAHVCSVMSRNDVTLALQQLLRDKKIQRAHHPSMRAFRILQPQLPSADSAGERKGGTILLADNDDDGEAGAGSKLASLLDILRAENVLVVVTRWYGGIHLGPDRFKHIANTARIALQEGGFLNCKEGVAEGGERRKGKKHGNK